jgi:ABC-type oligopeptide transport system substrate-binding subunit
MLLATGRAENCWPKMKNQRTIALVLALVLLALATMSCGSKNSTPTKAFQTYIGALKNKDGKALKSVMPKTMLDAGEKMAKAQNKTIDDLIKEDFDKGRHLPDKMPGTKNETIASDGKTATLEVNDHPIAFPDSDRWVTFHFVKEDDGWKIKEEDWR